MKRILNRLVAATMLVLAGCSTEQPPQSGPPRSKPANLVALSPEQLQNADIKTARPTRKTIAATLQVNGVMEAPPQRLVSVSVPLGGYIKKTGLLPGMHLQQGQLLAEVEDQAYIQLQQDYLTANVRLTYLQQEYARQHELNQSKASSDKVYQQTLADYKSQRILVRSLAEKLRLAGIPPHRLTEKNISRTLRLYSPIDGYVTRVNVNKGKYVVPTDVLFELVDPRDLHLMLTVFEKDLEKLKVGQVVLAYRPHQPEKKYRAKIIYIGTNVALDRAVEVHCHLQGARTGLLPGMFMNAVIETERQQAYALPEKAIVLFENKQYVFAVKGTGVYEMVEAQTGNSQHGYTILQPNPGLPRPGDRTFVTNGAYSLLMKLKNKAE